MLYGVLLDSFVSLGSEGYTGGYTGGYMRHQEVDLMFLPHGLRIGLC